MQIIDETGRGVYFYDDGTGNYVSQYKDRSTLELSGTDYIWHRVDEKVFIFNADGQLISIEDEIGNTQSLAYDANARLDTVTDNASGRGLKFHYDASDLLTSVTNSAGTKTWVTYGYTDQNLTSVTYGDGSGFVYEYNDVNDAHNMTRKLDKMDHFLSSWAYDTQDRATDNITRDGRGVVIDYDTYAAENKIKVTDTYGKIELFTVDGSIAGKKKITNIEGDAGCSSCGDEVVRVAYNTDLRVTEIEYANGRIDKFENFDSRGNAQTEIQDFGTADEKTITNTYHPDSFRKLSRTEASVLGTGNRETIWDYDDDYNATPNENPTKLVHRLIEKGFTSDAAGAVVPYEYITVYQYNAKGQVTSIDGPLPGPEDTTSLTYDPGTGDPASIILPIVGSLSFSNYDEAGNPGLLTDANQQQTVLTYDERSRLLTMTTNGVTSGQTFNTAGDLESRTESSGRVLSYAYDDDYGRLETILDVLGGNFRYGYDQPGRLVDEAAYDAAAVHRYQSGYDYNQPLHPGSLWKILHANGTATVFDYDAMGNIASVTDPRGKRTEYAYNHQNQLSAETRPGPVTTGFGYDQHGNLESVTDARSNATSFVYDDLGRPVTEISPDSGTTRYSYDAADNMVSQTDANDISVTYSYDVLGRLTGVAFPDTAQNSTLGYDEGTNGKGRLTSMTDPAGSTNRTYNTLGLLAQEVRTVNATPFTIGYSYGPNTTNLAFTTYPSGLVLTYQYDANGEISAILADGQPVVQNISYLPFGPVQGYIFGDNVLNVSYEYDLSYRTSRILAGTTDYVYTRDAAGNVESITGMEVPSMAVGGTQFAYPQTSNRLESSTGQQTAQYTHDDHGNITSDGTRTFIYNQDNRLAQVKEGTTVLADYSYDGFGRRVKKVAAGVVTLYHYDLENRLMAESLADGTPLRDYIYLGDVCIAVKLYGTQAGIYYAVNDHIGTPQKIVDATGTTVWQAAYLPFGKASMLTETITNNLRFPGQYYDQETGLHYNWHRYYDPSTGRYLTPDPIGLAGGINVYLYVTNNPINFVDPMGLLLTVGDVTGVAVTVATEAARQAGKISSSAATIIGIITASLGDLISPNIAGERDWRPMEDILHDKKIAELLKGWTELRKEYDELCRQTGGCDFDPDPCK